jgi:hypothetical protein
MSRGPLLLLVACAWGAFSAPQAGAVSPLPSSDYGVQQLCSTPAPGQAACLGLKLVPRTRAAAARTRPLGMAAAGPLPGTPSSGAFGLRPADLHNAYQLPSEAPTTQTIALVDAYNDPTAESDLRAYDEEFKLRECSAANGCFKQVNQRGESGNLPFPKTSSELESRRSEVPQGLEEAEEAEGWGLEISLDIETAHAICQSCRILLVEADSPSYEDLMAAEDSAVARGAKEVSNSWGGEPPPVDDAALNHPGVVITAAAGDSGHENWLSLGSGFVDYPASSPHVVAVGGTRLRLNPTRTAWEAESVWNDGGSALVKPGPHGAGGGGCEERFPAPAWQRAVADWEAVGCGGARSVADVSADADPYSGVAVRDSGTSECGNEQVPGWCTIGGTSLASPIIAATFALAGGANGVPYPAQTLYENETTHAGSLHDVTSGSNGRCTKAVNASTGESTCTSAEEAGSSCAGGLSCLAAPAYDGPTGVGTPKGLAAFTPSASGEGPSGPVEPPVGSRSSSSGAAEALVATYPALARAAGGPPPPQLFALALTRRALAALNRARPRMSLVSFAFTLTAAANVKMTLAKRVVSHRRARWQAVSRPHTTAAASGRDRAQLSGRGVLGRGRYQLKLAIAGGGASLVFVVG